MEQFSEETAGDTFLGNKKDASSQKKLFLGLGLGLGCLVIILVIVIACWLVLSGPATEPDYLYLGKDTILKLPTFEEVPCQQGFPESYAKDLGHQMTGAVVSHHGNKTLMLCGVKHTCFVWTSDGWKQSYAQFDRKKLADRKDWIHAASSVLPDGRWLVSGGEKEQSYDVKKPISSTKIYKDFEGWSDFTRLTFPTDSHCQVSIGNTTYIIGGESGDTQFSSSVYSLSEDDKWVAAPSLATPRSSQGCVAWGDKIYVVGGQTQTGYNKFAWLSSVEVLDTSDPTNTWVPGPEFPVQISNGHAVLYHDVLYVLGGGSQYGYDGALTGVYSLARGSLEWTWVASYTNRYRNLFPAPILPKEALHCCAMLKSGLAKEVTHQQEQFCADS